MGEMKRKRTQIKCKHCDRKMKNAVEYRKHLHQREVWGKCIGSVTNGYQEELADLGWTDDDYARNLI